MRTASDIRSVIEEALAKRSALLTRNCPIRLFDSTGDGAPGLWIDRYQGLALVHIQEQHLEALPLLRQIAPELLSRFSCDSIYARVHSRRAIDSGVDNGELLAGLPVSPIWIHELDLEFLVNPIDQVNAGLFVDMREVRQEIRRLSDGKRVLNCFAFTGSLGIAALAGGAVEVVQSDISKRILSWAKKNFERNMDLYPVKEMRFIAEDSRLFMTRELRRMTKGKESYDIVIIDPPSYGSSFGKPFRLKDEYESLLELGTSLLGDGGRLLFTTNLISLTPRLIESSCMRLAEKLGRKISQVTPIHPPQDFTAGFEAVPNMRGILVAFE